MMPGEFEPHEKTLICWPMRAEIYDGALAQARAAHAELAQAIAAFEPVVMIADPSEAEEAQKQCGGSVEVVAIPIDDAWVRDTGPIYIRDSDGQRTATIWKFNSWGEKYLPYDNDAALARSLAEHRGDTVRELEMVFEGGALTTDGQGTAITTTQCLMNSNRNPSLTRLDIETQMRRALGIKKLLWLPYGLVDDHDTDGHVDNVAAFSRDGHVIMQGCDDEARPDHERLNINGRWLSGQVAASGDAIAITTLPTLPFFTSSSGQEVAVPYANFYIANGAVFVPICGHEADGDTLDQLSSLFPDRRVIGLDIGGILAVGGGGIHCITQQIPAV